MEDITYNGTCSDCIYLVNYSITLANVCPFNLCYKLNCLDMDNNKRNMILFYKNLKKVLTILSRFVNKFLKFGDQYTIENLFIPSFELSVVNYQYVYDILLHILQVSGAFYPHRSPRT